MPQSNIDINPTLTVHELLEAYPILEEVLISIAPPFEKLKNPFLRKTVAKVATIKHIASVGGVPLDNLITQLKEAVGQSGNGESFDDENYFGEQPSWFSSNKIVLSINEDKLDDKDKMPLVALLKDAKKVKKGEIIELVSSFLPAPGIDIMKSKGYSVWTCKIRDDLIKSYFRKNSD